MKIDSIKSPIKNENISNSIKTDKQDAQLREMCQDFESVFVSYLLKSMRKTIPNSDLDNNSFSKDVYTSMMDEEIARNVAKGPGIGLAEVLYRQFKDNKKF